MKHLVIAEKPSVGRDIARVLHCNKKTNTYIEGTDYIVTWALGRLSAAVDGVTLNLLNGTRPGTWIRFPCSQSTGSW